MLYWEIKVKEVPQKTKSNLTKREQKALLRLKQNKSIIIKNADKGGAIVIQDVQKYKDEALRQLNNEQFYKKLKHDKTEEHAKKISAVLKQLGNRNEIPKEMVKDLNVKKPRTPVFYTQPKIHKENNPGRPVISSSGCRAITKNFSPLGISISKGSICCDIRCVFRTSDAFWRSLLIDVQSFMIKR